MSSLGQSVELPRATLLAKDLAPWQPAIDARKSDKPQIISGRNFRDLIDGPASAWSNEFVNFNSWDATTRKKISELRFDADIFYGTPTGVYRINPTSYVAELIIGPPHITSPVANTYWPWTMAFVGGVYYIAQYDIGLWQWDPVTQTLTEINTPMGSAVRYVIEDHGRLVAISDTVVAWSALDDGTDFIPDLASGASAQALSIIEGTALRLESMTDGVILYTTAGSIKGVFTTQAYVYSWPQIASRVVKIFTPNSNVFVPQLGIVSVDGNGLWLTEEYNYTTFGRPQPWEPDKSNYIKNNIINGLNRQLYGTMQLYYSQALQCLFISFSSNLIPGFFQTTLVHDVFSKRWSSFDLPHYGIFETYDYQQNVFTCSFMDANGYMKAFSNTDFTEDYPTTPELISDFVYRPTQTDAKVILTTDLLLNSGNPYELGSTSINGSDRNPFFYSNYTTSGVYELNDDTPYSDTNFPPGDPPMNVVLNPIIGSTNIDMFMSGGVELIAHPYIVPEISLDSNIVIGPWRFNDQKAFAEEVSAIESILIGCQAANGFEINEDWNTLTQAEDWNAISGAEDWSSGSAVPNSYNLTLISSEDSFSTPIQGNEYLPVYGEFTSSKLYKPMGFSAIYHALVLSADSVGQAFALKTIDLTAAFTGVYQDG